MNLKDLDELVLLAQHLAKLQNNHRRAIEKSGRACRKGRDTLIRLKKQLLYGKEPTANDDKHVQRLAEALFGQALLLNNSINWLMVRQRRIIRHEAFLKLSDETGITPILGEHDLMWCDVPPAIKKAVDRLNAQCVAIGPERISTDERDNLNTPEELT